jgi:hypothetical protein
MDLYNDICQIMLYMEIKALAENKKNILISLSACPLLDNSALVARRLICIQIMVIDLHGNQNSADQQIIKSFYFFFIAFSKECRSLLSYISNDIILDGRNVYISYT